MVQIINCTDFFWRDNYLAYFKHNKRKKTIFNIPLRECSDASIQIDHSRLQYLDEGVRPSHVKMILYIHWGLDFSFRVNWFRIPWRYYISTRTHICLPRFDMRTSATTHVSHVPFRAGFFFFIPGSSPANLLELNVLQLRLEFYVFFFLQRKGRENKRW